MKAAFALLVLLTCAVADDATAPRMILKKEFPGSKPPYMEIRLSRDGQVEYLEQADDDQPVKFKLGPNETETLFLLSDKLDHFARPLESGLKVARVGDKTFTWIKGDERHEVKFNYTLDADGQTLLDWFERMCESAYYKLDLERAVRFDRIGVNQALLKLEAAWDRKRLVAVEQYLPLLDRVAKNESYLNMARERAEKLAAIFRTPAAPQAAAGEAKP
jgi:hypothetical protein